MKEFPVLIEHKLTSEDIDNIMCSALEGGITYWCRKAEVANGDYKGKEWAHEVIAEGGAIILHSREDKGDPELDKQVLTLEKFLEGWKIFHKQCPRILDIDTIDAGLADCIVQCAVFGKIIYA